VTAAALTAVWLGAATPALAQYRPPPPPPYGAPPGPYGAVLPPYEVITIIRSMGFDPVSRPLLRGPVYVVRALDEVSTPVRVLVDARRGNVVRVVENRAGVYAGIYAGVGRPPEADFGLRRPPPQTVPPGAVYPPYEDEPMPPVPPAAQIPPPPRPKVAARTPLPKPAPQTRPAAPPPAVATIPDPSKTPGKSIPAPVANKSATANNNNAATDKNDVAVTGSTATGPVQASKPADSKPSEFAPTVMVPVAPLE